MGLFDKGKRRKDDYDSPVEQIDLSTPAAVPTLSSSSSAATDDERDAPATAATVSPSRSSDDRRARAAAEDDRERRPAVRRPSGYGIDDAIALMRTLPSENVELVVQVVKVTLESTKIEIGAIIEDASEKQARIESRIKVLRGEIADLETEISTRRKEIESLDADHRETTMVKDRLQLAERLSSRPGEQRPNRPTGELPRPKPTTQPPVLGAAPPPTPPPAAASAPTSSGAVVAASSPASGPMLAAEPTGAGRPSTQTVIVKK